MSEEQVTDGALSETQEPVQAQEQAGQPSSTEVESVAVESNDSLNNVPQEASKGSTQEKTSEWYESELAKRNAENKRRREKQEKSDLELKRAQERIKELESSAPKREDYDDLDVYERDTRRHDTKVAYAEERALDLESGAVVSQEDNRLQDALSQANESYSSAVKDYFNSPDAVSVDAYAKKQARFNESLLSRSLDEQKLIINELAAMGKDAAEVVMNIADDSQLLYELQTAKTPLQAANVLLRAEKPKKTTEAPAPTPEIGGDAGKVQKADLKTFEGIRQWKAEQGLR